MIRLAHHATFELLLAAALLTGGCGNSDQERKLGVRQTGLPGHLTAGGASSGEVLSRSQQATISPAPAGTPGIPQGSGGNTGGAALGGTTTGAQQEAERAKQNLANAMDTVSKRWRTRATANGWELFPPTPVNASLGFDASATQAGASGQPGGRLGPAAQQVPINSEKSGTAAPSADVKQDSKPQSPPGVRAKAPERVN